MSEFLTKDQLVAASQREYHSVEVEGIGTLRVQTLNDLEHSDISAAIIGTGGKVDPMKLAEQRRMVAWKMLVDGKGERLFDSPDQVGELNPKIVRAVYAKYMELADGGLSKEVKQQKKD